ncbi:MAG: hypothetical protein QOC99_251 [Acidobacteriota bacterium]|jgi:hypothetical protein|nr:hypothetical protein [Acidobacteriota bacterium]
MFRSILKEFRLKFVKSHGKKKGDAGKEYGIALDLSRIFALREAALRRPKPPRREGGHIQCSP